MIHTYRHDPKTGHDFETHQKCDKDGCLVCDGGLSMCVTCGGAEASLPSQCPRERMSAIQEDAVQAGVADYRDGHWFMPVRGKG